METGLRVSADPSQAVARRPLVDEGGIVTDKPLAASASETIYVFAWGNTPERAAMQGRRCRQLARGGKGTVLIEFEDTGERETVSFRALRRADHGR